MRLTIILLVTAALAAPAAAQAHTLSFREARTQIANLVHTKARYGYLRGSLEFSQPIRLSAHRIRYSIDFLDTDGDEWYGTAWARLVGSSVYSNYSINPM